MWIVTAGQGDGALLGVDGEEAALVADVGFGDERDLGAQLGHSGRHDCEGWGGRGV